MLSLGEVQINGRGGKAVPITPKDGHKLCLQLGTREDPLETPFRSSKWDSDSRATLEFNVTTGIHGISVTKKTRYEVVGREMKA